MRPAWLVGSVVLSEHFEVWQWLLPPPLLLLGSCVVGLEPDQTNED